MNARKNANECLGREGKNRNKKASLNESEREGGRERQIRMDG
jgi:hypothetical protein